VGTFEEITRNMDKPVLVISDDIIPSMWLYSQLEIMNEGDMKNTFFKDVESMILYLKWIDSYHLYTKDDLLIPLDLCKWIFITRNM